MFKFNVSGIEISINLSPGIYIMNNKSAVGKTRLGLLLEKKFISGDATFYYSYNDYLKGVRLSDILAKREYSVVLIDRLDMFINDYNVFNDIDKYKYNTIFLLDLKSISIHYHDLQYCNVKMRETEIEVK